MNPVEKVLTIARAEIGYLEKKSNSQLDSKTANAGDRNFTKFARDLDKLHAYSGSVNGYAWCTSFVFWCFVQAFGLDTALKMTCQAVRGDGASCTCLSNRYKAAGRFFTSKTAAQAGDQIFFLNGNGAIAHTGIVEKVSGGLVCTIEGNTSSQSGVVANGGSVERKSYPINYLRIAGYGRPDYSLAAKATATTIHAVNLKEDDYMTGEQIYNELQKYLASKQVPANLRDEFSRAVEYGITDGSAPGQLVSRYQVAVMAKRAAEIAMKKK